MELHVLRRFYLILEGMGVRLATSRVQKEITDTMLARKPGSYFINTEAEFFTACKRVLYEKDSYIHLLMDKRRRGIANDLLVIDVDSVTNGELLQRVNRLLKGGSPFVNNTPNGVHLFFFNSGQIKWRQYSSILNCGVMADVFSRGWVTFLGTGYDLFCLERNPLDVRVLPALPLLFQRSPSKERMIRLGKILPYKRSYFLNHFDLNTSGEPRTLAASELVHHFATVFPLVFPYKHQYPKFLQLLLDACGCELLERFEEVREKKLLWDPDVELNGEEHLDKMHLRRPRPFKMKADESGLEDEDCESDLEDSFDFESDDEKGPTPGRGEDRLSDQDISDLYQPVYLTLQMIEDFHRNK